MNGPRSPSIRAHVDGVAIEVRASIGSATFPQSGANASELLKRADEAMYRAKAARRTT